MNWYNSMNTRRKPTQTTSVLGRLAWLGLGLFFALGLSASPGSAAELEPATQIQGGLKEIELNLGLRAPIGLQACDSCFAKPTKKPPARDFVRKDLEVSELLQKLKLTEPNARGCTYTRDKLIQRARADSNALIQDLDHWNCLELMRNFERDSMKQCLVDPDALAKFRVSRRHEITGTVSYMNAIPLKYAYDAWWSEKLKKNIVEVRIRFRGILTRNAEQMARYRGILEQASQAWNDSLKSKNFSFVFRMVEADEKPHFTVGLSGNKVRGLYLSQWSIHSDVDMIAHEVGHMLGLDDEYDQMRLSLDIGETNSLPQKRCNPSSRLCSSALADAKPQPQHLYLVLRRLACQPGEPRPKPRPDIPRFPADRIHVESAAHPRK